MWLKVLQNKTITANINAICNYAGNEPNNRKTYFDSLNQIQQTKLKFGDNAASIHLNFGDDIGGFKQPFSTITNLQTLPHGWQYSPDERQLITKRVNDALNLLGIIEPAIEEAINLLIGTFICAKVKGFDGGSISSLIGTIWIGLNANKPAINFAELILHEFVHNALFIDDMVNCIFLFDEKTMSEEKGLVTSAILKIKRGYDKAFHSAYVAVTLAHFYSSICEKQLSETFLHPVSATIKELYEKTDYLSPHGAQRLEELNIYYSTLISNIVYEQDKVH